MASSSDSGERENELRIVLLGKTGVGKSSTGNTILGREAFTAESSQQSVTKESKRESAEINGRHVTVIDTPGLFDTELSNEEIQREITNCISMILPGPHVFLLLIPVGRFTREEANAVKIIQETFGENSLMFTIVLFTRGDDLKDRTIEKYVGRPGSPLMKLIEACRNRFHVFNNNQTGDRTQVSDLLKKIDDMVKVNGDSYYSCKMFREMEREIQETEKEKMKMMMEEERQNHDKERKRREEMKREREEWERQKQQERQRRDEEDERRRKKEQAMWDEYNQILQQAKGRMKVMMEEERQNHDKERKRKEEEFREREEQYKRDIKDIEDQERKMREEMKREQEEGERQKQQVQVKLQVLNASFKS